METKELSNIESVSPEIIKSLVLDGDLSKMSGEQKVSYFKRFCEALGLNPLTQPFQIIKFQGKEELYATKDCTEQLRKIHSVSITELTSQEIRGVFVVTAKAQDKTGKTDAATGAVTIGNKTGEDLANLLMKAETKAKRRVTLSICGLGMLDESELDTMPIHTTTPVEQTKTNEIQEPKPEVKKPASKPGKESLTPKDKKAWINTVQKLAGEKVTIKVVEDYYSLTPEHREQLLAEAFELINKNKAA